MNNEIRIAFHKVEWALGKLDDLAEAGEKLEQAERFTTR